MQHKFPRGVAEKVKYYVYRLIDPRNGETFYVGKGKGDRVFQHARGGIKVNLSSEEDDILDAKIQRINEIKAAGLEVGHVIHRHGIEDEEVAFQIEAAVMDAYPGLTNKVGGRESSDFGVAHVVELITLYAAEAFVPKHRLLLISIGISFREWGRSPYDAVRCAWRIKPERAKGRVVLAHDRGLVLGAYIPIRWMEATKENFPILEVSLPKRWGFEGEEAAESISNWYVRKRVPDKYRKRGAASPIRFIDPE